MVFPPPPRPRLCNAAAVTPHRITAAVFFLSWAIVLGSPAPADNQLEFFEKKIRPVLVKHCYECHSADSDELGGKLRVDNRQSMLAGGESGPVLLAGSPDESLIIQALRYDGLEMPPEEPLPATIIKDFETWVSLGAVDPRDQPLADASSRAEPNAADDESLWSFVPRQDPPVPSVNDSDWARDSIDRFVLSSMRQIGLHPTDDADPRKLVRRLYHDLIGLRPTQADIEAFLVDFDRHGVEATARLVDRLLNSPQYGVRWGRHWLDVARYGESNGDDGLGRNATFPNAWRYRDYVIESFNQDVPYDRFLTEQIAGDLLPAATAQQRNRQLIATGFLAIGSKPAVAMNKNFAMDVVDDQINVVCTGVLGLSVACARCHDHKHDPIPTKDYYALAGIFRSTETLYGAAGNEKLTAPPTPLHELHADLQATRKQPDRTSPPKLPAAYSEFINALEPKLHATLESKPDELVLQGEADFSAATFAEVNDTRFTGRFDQPTESYSVSFWFRNAVNNDARPITAYLFSRAALDDKTLPGDHLGIGGKHDKSRSGKLFVFNGNVKKTSIVGSTVIPRNSWNHVALVRAGNQVKVFLNGRLEIASEIEATFATSLDYCLAARSDKFAPLTGNIGQFTLLSRALSDDEVIDLHRSSGQPRGVRPSSPLGFAMGVREKAKPTDCKIHINGEGTKLGPSVTRGVLTAYRNVSEDGFNDISITIGSDRSGRAELAEWLTHPDHPQTARVIVNRIWMHLFGRGIVTTPDDFGVYGARPSHPELLDHLANRFVREGWSIKRMIRAIVLSRTYGLSSLADSGMTEQDPENIWLSRHARKRLDAESLRDSMLQASGRLDYAPAKGSAIETLDTLINWPPGASTDLHRQSHHRSVYLCMLRHASPQELAAFDLPDGVSVRGKRDVTTLPTQSLFLINSVFAVEQSRELARRVLDDDVRDDGDRLRAIFSAVLGRDPSESERDRSFAYLRTTEATLAGGDEDRDRCRLHAWASLAQALMTTNEFRYVD
ncbi:Planctomycete cytochrome C [Stieleria magnilauensis]|uniref:Planctomycete cytochrome C n=1 Tax=Stieleria magnilauensis TaxID=2527963 RepID=A0ABX5Y3U0_9BACT|nr:Planctomycete cytochrome C [Planctomycetes bacterium TBK1r]